MLYGSSILKQIRMAAEEASVFFETMPESYFSNTTHTTQDNTVADKVLLSTSLRNPNSDFSNDPHDKRKIPNTYTTPSTAQINNHSAVSSLSVQMVPSVPAKAANAVVHTSIALAATHNHHNEEKSEPGKRVKVEAASAAEDTSQENITAAQVLCSLNNKMSGTEENPKKKTLPQTCRICGVKYESILQHYQQEHPDKELFPCPICPSWQQSKGRLKEHQIVHSDARPFECGECKRTFKRQSEKNKHQRDTDHID